MPYYTVVDVTWAGRNKRISFNTADYSSASSSLTTTNVFDLHAWWPDCVRKACRLQVQVVLYDCRPGGMRNEALECPFAPASQLVFSLAHAAVSCNDLRMEVVCRDCMSPATHLADGGQVLAGTAAFTHAKKCELNVHGDSSASESLENAIKSPAVPIRSGRPLTRMFTMFERAQRYFVALKFAPWECASAVARRDWRHSAASIRARDTLYRIKGRLLRDTYLPVSSLTALVSVSYRISERLSRAFGDLEEFLAMPQTQELLAWNAQVSGQSGGETKGAVLLPDLAC